MNYGKEKRAELAREFVRLHDVEGVTYEQIGWLYMLSKQRVHQIVTKERKRNFLAPTAQGVSGGEA